MAYKTLEQEKLDNFKKFKLNKPVKYQFGKKFNYSKHEMVLVHSFIGVTSCNLIHGSDICNALFDKGIMFKFVYKNQSGRDYMSQFIIFYKGKEHYLTVHASGYGFNDTLYFNKGFSKKVKFDLCRELAMLEYKNQIEYYNIVKSKTSEKEVVQKMEKNIDIYYEVSILINTWVNNFKKLKETRDLAIYELNIDFYNKMKNKGKQKVLTREIDWTERAKKFFLKFESFKKKEVYKIYKKIQNGK